MYILSELNGHFQYFEIETQNTKIYLNHVPTSFQNVTSTILLWSLDIESRRVLLECHSLNDFRTPDVVIHCYPIFYYSQWDIYWRDET